MGGAIAFVDDFTAWVTGPTAQGNRKGIEAIINDALDWERRSGATFEAEKTAVIHFTKKSYKMSRTYRCLQACWISHPSRVRDLRNRNGNGEAKGHKAVG